MPPIGLMLLIALAYVVAGKLGLSLAYVNASATAVWFPSGISLAAFLIWGNRIWPGIAVGAFTVNMMTSGSIPVSFGITIGNTLEGLCGAWLITRFAGGLDVFNQPKTIFHFFFLAGLGATTISATLGATSLCLGGLALWTEFAPIWLTWWLGDASGCLLMAPMLVLWNQTPRPDWDRADKAELVLILCTLAFVGLVVFGPMSFFRTKHYPLEFLCLPIVTCVAFRHGLRETATIAFLLSCIAIAGTLHGYGPFVSMTQNESLLLLQTYMAVTCLTGLVIAAVVSENKQSKELLSALNRDLELRVDARTKEIQEINRELEAYSYTVSHDLQAPLRSIDGFSRELEETSWDKLDERAKLDLKRIRSAAQRMTRMIADLLRFARTTRAAMTKKDVNLSRLVETVGKELQATFPERQVALDITPDAHVKGDPNLLQIVVENLLQNAWKFTQHKPEARVEFGREERDGKSWFFIRDNGVGFDMKNAGKLFDPFQRLHTEKEFAGSGVGLATAQRILQRHGGSIHVQAAENQGATFYFTL